MEHPNTKQVFISWDVKFDEDTFSFTKDAKKRSTLTKTRQTIHQDDTCVIGFTPMEKSINKHKEIIKEQHQTGKDQESIETTFVIHTSGRPQGIRKPSVILNDPNYVCMVNIEQEYLKQAIFEEGKPY